MDKTFLIKSHYSFYLILLAQAHRGTPPPGWCAGFSAENPSAAFFNIEDYKKSLKNRLRALRSYFRQPSLFPAELWCSHHHRARKEKKDFRFLNMTDFSQTKTVAAGFTEVHQEH
ncbi:MAG: hypothetical protein V1743_01085 [Nanoarchaeota archaeon]